MAFQRDGDRAAGPAEVLPIDEQVPVETSRKNQKWKERDSVILKYVEDNLQIDKICMETADRVGEDVRDKHAVKCQNLFRRIKGRTQNRGMKVNASKTAMLCISGATSYHAQAHITTEGGDRVQSGDNMKVLGFNLSSRARVHAHVEALRKRFRKRYWCFYHLRHAGFDDDELARVYRTILLPLADNCAVVYHSILTDEQDQVIERLQAQTLRCIYGPYISYEKMRERAGVTTLRQSRIEMIDKFANKCLGNTVFSKWFPLRQTARGGPKGRREILGRIC